MELWRRKAAIARANGRSYSSIEEEILGSLEPVPAVYVRFKGCGIAFR
jgi:hypothetical protein